MRRLPGPACCRLSEGDHPPEALYELFRTGREQTAPYSPELEPDIVLNRTATAAPHASGVDETLHTPW